MINPMDMTGKRVLVTGAGSGIGRATAVLLSELGAAVVLVGRDADKLSKTSQLLTRGDFAIVPFDLSTPETIPEWMRTTATELGRFDGLVHCAGIQTFNPLRSLTVKGFERLLTVNTVSAAMLIKAMQNLDCGADRASIVMVASAAAILGIPANGPYGASKAAVMSLVRTFALETVDRHIRINAVAPALVETEIVQRSRELMTADAFQSMVEKHPMGIGRPEDIANAICFLLSDAARWITGTTLVIDGGMSVP
jgi:NAD(P)-dependent dehydrogenase (short-subunit alcohol dehydrogenase family)